MSATFLSTTVANMLVAVEVAWGADLTDLTGAGWTWTDITAEVLLEGEEKISITLGRPDFSSETQTAEMTCRLDNRASKYSAGGLSPHWPYVRRGTPVRVRVSNNGGSNWYTRFQGSANGFTPEWDALTGRWATVVLSASGPLRRLNQGTLPAKSVYTTEIPRSTGWAGMFMYWPSEGGDGRRNMPSAVPASGYPAMQLFDLYPPKTANNPSNTAFPLSGPMQSSFVMFTGQGFSDIDLVTIGDTIPTYTDTGILQFRFMLAVPGAYPVPQDQGLLNIRTSNTTVRRWTLQINETGALRVNGENDSGTILREGAYSSFAMNGEARLISLTLDNNGSSLDATIRTLDQEGNGLVWSQTFSSSNIGVLNGVHLNGTDFSDDGTGTSNGLISHISVHNSAQAITTTAATEDVFRGLPGETPHSRLTRLCTNHGIALEVLSATDVPITSIIDSMGPQYYDTLTTLMRECETTGQGVLYDGLGPGLTYVTKRRRETNASSAASLVLDASAGRLTAPFTPVDDDQLTINHCDVSVRNGTTVSYIDETGPLGAEAIGDYATSISVNPEVDTGVIHYAEWIVGLGRQEGYRYPTVSFALETNPSLIAGWLACLPQARIDVTNVVAIRRQHPSETIKMLLEGWHEEIGAFTWRVTANTSPAAPWNVTVLAAATGSTGDGICHMDTDGSQLNASAILGATSISVKTNTGPLWVQSSADADSFPFDLNVGGCRVTVTAISGASSPQTFTLASPGLPRAMTGSTTVGAGTPVRVWQPPVYGL